MIVDDNIITFSQIPSISPPHQPTRTIGHHAKFTSLITFPLIEILLMISADGDDMAAISGNICQLARRLSLREFRAELLEYHYEVPFRRRAR